MSSYLQGCFCFFGQNSKYLLVIDGQFGQHFTVNRDLGFLQTVDKAAVGKAMLTCSGIDTDNPQLTELTLSRLAVALGILTCLNDRLFGDAEDFATGVVIALGSCQYFFVTGAGGNASFNSCHVALPLTNHLLDGFNITLMHHNRTAQAAFTLGGFFGENVSSVRVRTFVAARCFFEALGGASVGFHFRHM